MFDDNILVFYEWSFRNRLSALEMDHRFRIIRMYFRAGNFSFIRVLLTLSLFANFS